jgi:hypothetical protein
VGSTSSKCQRVREVLRARGECIECATVGCYGTEQADTCGAAVGEGGWDTFKPACKLTKRASATKRAQTVDVKAVGGWVGGWVVWVGGGGVGGHSNIGAACKTAHRGRGMSLVV